MSCSSCEQRREFIKTHKVKIVAIATAVTVTAVAGIYLVRRKK